jgi:hypothetical protein
MQSHLTGYPSSWPVERQERWERLQQRAREVFGNQTDAGLWLHRLNPAIADGRCPPSEAGRLTSEGFTAVLAALDRLSLSVVPDPHEPGRLRKQRHRR